MSVYRSWMQVNNLHENIGDIWDSPVCPPSSTGSDPTVPYPPPPPPPKPSLTRRDTWKFPWGHAACIKGFSVKTCFRGNRTTENLFHPCLKIFQRDRFQIWIFQKLLGHTRNWFGMNVGVRRGLLMKNSGVKISGTVPLIVFSFLVFTAYLMKIIFYLLISLVRTVTCKTTIKRSETKLQKCSPN